jgi:hypothetical protein
VTGARVVDCLDDACARQHRWGSNRVPISNVTVGEDGTVVLASITRPNGDRDTVHLERCTRAGECAQADVVWRTDRSSPQPIVAAAAGPGGSMLVATAQPAGEGRVALAVTRCADLACGAPEVTELGVVAAAGDATLTVRARPDGTPDVMYRSQRAHVNPAALAVTADGAYGLFTDVAPRVDELFGAFAEATPQQAQFLVAECAEPGCHRLGRRWRLNHAFLAAEPRGALVVTPDRRVLIAETIDRLLIVTGSLPA